MVGRNLEDQTIEFEQVVNLASNSLRETEELLLLFSQEDGLIAPLGLIRIRKGKQNLVLWQKTYTRGADETKRAL